MYTYTHTKDKNKQTKTHTHMTRTFFSDSMGSASRLHTSLQARLRSNMAPVSSGGSTNSILSQSSLTQLMTDRANVLMTWGETMDTYSKLQRF